MYSRPRAPCWTSPLPILTLTTMTQFLATKSETCRGTRWIVSGARRHRTLSASRKRTMIRLAPKFPAVSSTSGKGWAKRRRRWRACMDCSYTTKRLAEYPRISSGSVPKGWEQQWLNKILTSASSSSIRKTEVISLTLTSQEWASSSKATRLINCSIKERRLICGVEARSAKDSLQRKMSSTMHRMHIRLNRMVNLRNPVRFQILLDCQSLKSRIPYFSSRTLTVEKWWLMVRGQSTLLWRMFVLSKRWVILNSCPRQWKRPSTWLTKSSTTMVSMREDSWVSRRAETVTSCRNSATVMRVASERERSRDSNSSFGTSR